MNDSSLRVSDPVACAAEWLRAWDSQGVHRTGTEADAASAAWLAGEVERLGARAELEPFALDRLDPLEACLEIQGRRIDGVPVFDAPPTDGVTGTLGADIAVAELSPQAVYSGEYQALRRNTSSRALVILCKGAHPGLGLLNAEQFREPYGTPAVHLSSEARDLVLASAARGAAATLISHSRRTPSQAHNVVVRLNGEHPVQTPLVVMTPRSSWWQSTSERGGGLVCWLESLRSLIAAPPARNVVLTANSGHELGHLGLDAFLTQNPGWDQPEANGGGLWVHYGANIGAAGGELSVLSNDDPLRELADAALRNAGRPSDRIAPKTLVPSGETRDIHRAGGRYLTLVGSNALFHLPQDRWPHSVDPIRVAAIATAAAHMIVAISRDTGFT